MTRSTHGLQAQPGRGLAIATVLLLALSLLPSRWAAPVSWVGDLAVTLVAPISHPLRAVTGRLVPERVESVPEGIEQLAADRDRALLLLRQSEAQVERLEGLVRDLQSGVALPARSAVRALAAAVIATSSDLGEGVLFARAGSGDGVTLETVATTRGVRLVGRVEDVTGGRATVRVLTSVASGPIRGRIMPGARAGIDPGLRGGGLLTLLKPRGDGSLEGPVEFVGADEAMPPPEIGQLVRVDDEVTWPSSAQMLEIGLIERVREDDETPGRLIVTVRPQFTAERLAEVLLRIPENASGSASGPGDRGGR